MRRFLLSLGLTALFLSGTPSADAAGVSDLSVYLIYDTTGGPVEVGASHDQFASIRNGGPDASPALTVTVTASSGQQLTARTSGSSYTCSSNFARTVLTCQHPAAVRDAILPLHWSVKYTTATNKRVTVEVTGPNPDPDLSNNTGVITTSVPSSDLHVSASDDTGGRAVVGTTHEQSAFISNDGPSATPSATVTVTASAGQQLTASPSGGVSTCTSNAARTLLTCQFGSIPQGFVHGLHWKTTYTTGTAKTVTVKVSGPNVDRVASDNTAVIHTPGPSSDLSVTSLVDHTGGPARVGATHLQSVFLSNNGPEDSPVTMTVTASAGQQLTGGSPCVANAARSLLTCTFPHRQAGLGSRISWSVSYTTTTAKTITVEVSGPHADPVTANNSAVMHTRGPTSDLSVTQATDDTGGSALLGTTHEQSVVVGNEGPDSSPGTVVTVKAEGGQQLTPSFDFCSTNVAKSVMTCTIDQGTGSFVLRWSVTYTTATSKLVTITISGANHDPDPMDNGDVIHTPGPTSDLAVGGVLDETGGAAVVGATHQQSAFVTNSGPDKSSPLNLTVTASAGQQLAPSQEDQPHCFTNSAKTTMSCRFATVTSGSGFRVHWTVTYTTTSAKTVKVKVGGPNVDHDLSNNTAEIRTPAPISDVGVSNLVDDTGGAAVVNTTHQQSAFIRNDGPHNSPPVKVTVAVSPGQRLTIAEQHHEKCAINDARTIMTCSVPVGLGIIRLEWSVSYTTGTAKTVTVTVDGQHPDPVASNNKAVINTPAPQSDLRVSNAIDDTGGPAVVGATHQQSAFISNDGPQASPPLTVTVTANAGQQLAVPPLWQQSCGINGTRSVITCRVSGGIGTTRLSWSTTYTTETAKTVTIKVAGPHPDPVTTNNTAVIATRVPTSDLQVAGVDDDTGGPVVVGASHQQSGLIRNLGPDPTPSYVVTVTASYGQVLAVPSAEREWCRANRAGSAITCAYDLLANDAGRPVRWTTTYTTATVKTVTVKVSGPNADPATSNDSRILRAFP